MARRAGCGRLLWLALLPAGLLHAAPSAQPLPRPTPNIQSLSAGEVRALARDSQGRTLIAGIFARADGVPRASLLRLNADGTLDDSFDVAVNGTVAALAVASDDTIYIGGQFTVVGTQARTALARISSAGVVDAGFPVDPLVLPSSGSASRGVLALALDEVNESLYYGGRFAAGSAHPQSVAKISLTTGEHDPAFAIDLDAPVRSLLLDGIGGLYVGGTFGTVNGESRTGLARLHTNGSSGVNGLDPDFVPALQVASEPTGVYALALGPDALYVGGNFPDAFYTHLAKLDRATGAPDQNWRPGANGMVNAMVLVANDRLVIGGSFTTLGGQERRHLARVTLGGVGLSDADWRPAVSSGTPAALLVDGDSLLVGGGFDGLGGQPRTGFGAVSLSSPPVALAAMDVHLQSGSPGILFANQAMPDGSLWIGGNFTSIDGQPRHNLARLLPDGSLDPAVDLPVLGTVFDMAADASGRVYLAGDFDAAGGFARDGLARIGNDRQLDAGFSGGVQNAGGSGTVYEIDLSASALYAGGVYDAVRSDTVTSSPRDFIAKFDLGSGDPVAGWAPQVAGVASSANVQAVDVDADDQWVYIGGSFLSVDGAPHLNVARVATDTGAVDPAFVPSADDSQVWAIGADPTHGWVYIGGIFTQFNGMANQYGLVRVDPLDGSLDAGFQPGLDAYSQVESIFFDSEDAVCVGGYLGSDGGLVRFLLADGQRDTAFRPQVDNYVTNMSYSSATQSLIVSGIFGIVAGQARQNLAALPIGRIIFIGGFE